MDTLKRFYSLIAAFALLNLLALLGLAGFLVSDGTLTIEKLRAAVEVLRPVPVDAEEAALADAKPDAEDAPVDARDRGKPATPAEREIARLNLERVTQSAEDRLRYASRMMVDIERQREALAQQEDEAKQLRAEQAGIDADEVFQKDLEIVGLLKPKVALDNLLARPIDEAAHMLLSLDARAGKKMIEVASKDPRKWALMLRMQEKMRETIDAGTQQSQAIADNAP